MVIARIAKPMPYPTVDGIRIARAIANDRQSNANLTVDGINYSKIAKPTSYKPIGAFVGSYASANMYVKKPGQDACANILGDPFFQQTDPTGHVLYILHEFLVGSVCNGLQRPCMAPYELPKRI